MNVVEENLDLMVLLIIIIIIHSVRAYKSKYCSNKNILFLFFFSQVPSKPPEGIIAESHVTLTTIPVTWQPIDSSHIHGILLGYKIRYQAVAIGEEPVEDQPIREEIVSPSTFFLVLKNLEIFTLYRIDVMGYTIMGNGPPATDYAGLSTFQAYHALSQRIEYTFNDGFSKRVCTNVASNPANMIHLEGYNCSYTYYHAIPCECTVTSEMNHHVVSTGWQQGCSQIGRICLFFTLFRRAFYH